MRVLFLDIDGVVNRAATPGRDVGRLCFDRGLAGIVRDVVRAVPDLRVVLSSSWREVEKSRAIIERRVVPCFDVTPVFDDADDVRGYEIQAWLDLHPGVTRYAILDDDCDMLPHQLPNHFRTVSEVGITPEIAARVIAHLQA